ncbi:transcription antitermination factor NusB [bacterium 3DAC]|jgi:N utilization substance protein B|nr:transcription antitermination factor NusB [Dictyoglomota bacterium]UZN23187.1 transcription antitermination factor NusB [bacterium 3DAC]
MSLSNKYFRKLRKNLLTALYAYEVAEVKPSRKEVLAQVMADLKPSSKLKRHAKRIIATVIDKRDIIDNILRNHIKSTLFDRMGDLEKTILRIGAAEILFYRHLVPIAVAVNEAVNLAKLYVDDKFASLVNATLKGIAEEVTGSHASQKENKS